VEGVTNISDNITVYAHTLELQDERLHQVLDRLQEFQVTVNKDKCKFQQESNVYLKHSFSKEGTEPTRKKLKAIKEAE